MLRICFVAQNGGEQIPLPIPEPPPAKGGRPPRAGTAATHVLRVRLTPAEQSKLAALAAAQGRSVPEHVRARLVGNEAEAVAATPATPPPAPVEPPYVTAKPRPEAKPEIVYRWTPRYVWTLHLVPGRREGPPLAVRRRVLYDRADAIGVETPGGTCDADLEGLNLRGRTRSPGCLPTWALPGEKHKDLSLDVYDHNPTEAERAAWLDIRHREQAYIATRPRSIWAYYLGKAMDGVVLHPTDRRYHYRIAVPDFDQEIDLRRLAAAGVLWAPYEDRDTFEPCRVTCVWPRKPTREQIAQAEQERARRAARLADWKRAREEQAREQAAREAQAREEQEAAIHAALCGCGTCSWCIAAKGPPAVRAFGLDPKIATVDDVQRVFREHAKRGHSDQGGAADMGALVKQRDLARAYIMKRTAVPASSTATA